MFIGEVREVRAVPNPWLDGKDATSGFVDILLGWQDLKQADVYVTGSNSKMLSSDIMTEFKDRGDEIHINPLMYKEFYEAYEGDKHNAWQEYVIYGGMPRVLAERTENNKSRYLQDLIQKTYISDVIERNGIIKDSSVLGDLLNIVASGIGSLTNPTKLERTYESVMHKKISDSTIGVYLDYFNEAYLLRKAFQYNIKGRRYINSPLKYYFTDIGLRNAQLNFRQQEETHIMENIIYNELRSRGYNVDVGLVELGGKDENGKFVRRQLEVDFVVNRPPYRVYIQSAFHMPTPEKEAQERRPLLSINDHFRKIVIVGYDILRKEDELGVLTVGLLDFLTDKDLLEQG